MVEDQLDEVFHALAHPVRRDMVRRLAAAELTAGQLADPFTISLAASSKHLAVLERAGMVHRSVEGRRHVFRLQPEPLAHADAWVRETESFWNDRLAALAGLLEGGDR